jgi:hypothetical protein
MEKYDLITVFPAGIGRDSTRKFFCVETPEGEVLLPDPMNHSKRGANICACSYAVLEGDILSFRYYTAAVIGRWPFNQRQIGGSEREFARFRRLDNGRWEQI